MLTNVTYLMFVSYRMGHSERQMERKVSLRGWKSDSIFRYERFS